MRRVDSLGKTDAGRDWGQEEKGTTEVEMAGWHHWLDGRESEWTPGVGDGQGGLACCDSWGCKESDTTEWLNWTVKCVKSLRCAWLFETLWTIACQAPLSMEFSRQEYLSGLLFPSPVILPNPGTEHVYSALQADSLTSEPPRKPLAGYLVSFYWLLYPS